MPLNKLLISAQLATTHLFPKLVFAIAAGLFFQSPTLLADFAEIEPNDDSSGAQTLDGRFSLDSNPDVGDKTGNTSTSVPHATVLGTGSGPESADIYKFTVTEAGTATFDIDYGDISFRPDRFGIATQLDGTVWLKDEKDFYFLDEQDRPQWGFRADYSPTLHNVLAVHPQTGLFYSMSRGSTNLVTIDPDTGIGQNVGKTNVADITALAFNEDNRLYAVTGTDNRPSSLYELDPATGAVISLIGDTGNLAIKGIDFHPETGELIGFADQNDLNLRNSLAVDSNGALYSLGELGSGNDEMVFLYRLDPNSNEYVRVGSTGLSDVSAIAFDANDDLFAVTGSQQSPSTLYQLDPQTGAVVDAIGDTGLFGIVGLDFEPVTGTLFAYSNGPRDVRLEPTLTSAADGTIFAVQSSNNTDYLVTVDTEAPNLIHYRGKLPFDDERIALAMSEDNRLFATSIRPVNSSTDESWLYEINPANGALISEIGGTGYLDVESLSFDPVSGQLFAHANAAEPGSLRNSLASDTAGFLYSAGYDSLADQQVIFKLDPANWMATALPVSEAFNLSALAFDGADRLFALSGRDRTPSVLYEINPLSGAVEQVVGDTGESGLTGLDFHPDTGVLYGHLNGEEFYPRNSLALNSSGTAFTVANDDFSESMLLISFDPATGLTTSLGNIPNNDIIALAFDNSDQLFATTGSGGRPSRLLQIDPSNGQLVTDIGLTGFNSVTGLAFHPDTQVLYGHAQSPNQLITINPANAASALIGESNVSNNVADIGFDPDSEILYGITGRDGDIISFDLGTGEGTLVSDLMGDAYAAGIASNGTELFVKSESRIFSIDLDLEDFNYEVAIRGAGQLFIVDKSDGSLTPVVATNAQGNITDISFDPDTGQLFGWESSQDRDRNLVRIDTGSGNVTLVGESFINDGANGLAFSRDTGELLMKAREELYLVDKGDGSTDFLARALVQFPTLLTLDTTSGAGSPIGISVTGQINSSRWGEFSDLAFDTDSDPGNPHYGTLYGNHAVDGDVYTFDTTTGAATRLGESTISNNRYGLGYSGTSLYQLENRDRFRVVDQVTGTSTLEFIAQNEVTESDTLSTLSLVDAQPTTIGQTGVNNMPDMTFDDTGTLFAVQSGDLYTIDTDTGGASLVGNSGLGGQRWGLAFDDTTSTLFLKEENRLFSIDRADAAASYVTEYPPVPPRLLSIDPDTAIATLIGASTIPDHQVPDITFTQDGRLLGFENDDHRSLVEFDPTLGPLTTLWRFESDRTGLAVTSNGTLWLKLDDEGLFMVDQNNGQPTFFNVISDRGQDSVLTSDSSDRLYTNGSITDLDGPLLLLDPLTGESKVIGETGLEIAALAFDGSDRLFAMAGRFGDPNILYELDPSDGSIISTIGDTGITNIRAMDFHPDTQVLYAHSADNEALMSIDVTNATPTIIGSTGVRAIQDFAFSAEGRLFGWYAGEDFDERFSSSESLMEIDIDSGAARPITVLGDFSTRLTLLDTDGVTKLATNSGAEFSWGRNGLKSRQHEYHPERGCLYRIRFHRSRHVLYPCRFQRLYRCTVWWHLLVECVRTGRHSRPDSYGRI